MNKQTLKAQLDLIMETLETKGAEVDFDHFAQLATEREVVSVEQQLGFTLPEAFREALLTISSHVQFFWQLPEEIEFEAPNEEIFSGHLEWNLHELVNYKVRIEEIITNIYNDVTDEYDAIWLHKLPFLPIGNGDYLALELKQNRGAVVYLSHDGSSNHGRTLASDFTELLTTWSILGFVGAEDWQWEQFTENFTSGMNPNGEAALAFRKAMDL